MTPETGCMGKRMPRTEFSGERKLGCVRMSMGAKKEDGATVQCCIISIIIIIKVTGGGHLCRS